MAVQAPGQPLPNQDREAAAGPGLQHDPGPGETTWHTDTLTDPGPGETTWTGDTLTDWEMDTLTDWTRDTLTDWDRETLTDWTRETLTDWDIWLTDGSVFPNYYLYLYLTD